MVDPIPIPLPVPSTSGNTFDNLVTGADGTPLGSNVEETGAITSTTTDTISTADTDTATDSPGLLRFPLISSFSAQLNRLVADSPEIPYPRGELLSAVNDLEHVFDQLDVTLAPQDADPSAYPNLEDEDHNLETFAETIFDAEEPLPFGEKCTQENPASSFTVIPGPREDVTTDGSTTGVKRTEATEETQGAGLAPVTPQSAGSTTGTQGTASTIAAAATGPPKINPWLAGSMMVAFLVTFMSLVAMLVKNKEAQSDLQTKSINMMMALTMSTVDSIMKKATLDQKNYIAAAVCAGIACAGAAISAGYGARGSTGQTPKTIKPGATELNAIKMKPGTPEYKANFEKVGDQPALFKDSITKENIGKWEKQYGRKFEVGDKISGEGLTQDQALAHNKMVDENNAITGGGPNARESIATREKDITKAKEDNLKIANEEGAFRSSRMAMGNVISTITSQGAEAIKNAFFAANAVDIATQEALKTLLEGYRQVIQQQLNTSIETFKSDSDLVSQTLQTFDSMRSKLMDAINALMRKQ